MAKKEVEEDPPIDDSWLASYADAMTLLMAFFIMMFAFALVDEQKFLELKVGVVAALGVADPVTDNTSSILGEGQGIAPEIGLGAVPSSQVEALMRSVEDALKTDGTVTPDNVEEVKEYLEATYDLAGIADFVGVEITARGIVVRFESRLLFDSGAYSLTGDADLVLGETASALKNFDNFVDVEGHTDDRPTGSITDTNWHLSGNRASTVVEWLITRGKVEDVRLSARGFAATHPRESNETAEGRQENRRVELLILVDGLLESDVDLINAIPDDIVGGEKKNPLDGLEDDLSEEADGPAVDVEAEENGDAPSEDENASDNSENEDPGEVEGTTGAAPDPIDPIGNPVGIAPNLGADPEENNDG